MRGPACRRPALQPHRLLNRDDRQAWSDEPIRISSYRREWPVEFRREKAALEEAIGEWAVGGIHHIGSTAVPGLDAKPIVDILVGVAGLEVSRACFEPLAKLDYVHAPYRPEEMHWFCKPHPSRRTHHLHLVPHDSRRYAEELAFRDRLRADRETADRYAALKRELASRLPNDREAYTDAKGDFIRAALARAATGERRDRRSTSPPRAGPPTPRRHR